METHEILSAARALIADEKDWCKGDYEKPTGQRCAVGALWYVANTCRVGTAKAEVALESVLPVPFIVGYNDAKSTTHACVIAAFDAAIEKERDGLPGQPVPS